MLSGGGFMSEIDVACRRCVGRCTENLDVVGEANGPPTDGAVSSVEAFLPLLETSLETPPSFFSSERPGLVLATGFAWKDAAVEVGRNKETTMVRWSEKEVISGLFSYFLDEFERLLPGEGGFEIR
jgi:hypothetical protein